MKKLLVMTAALALFASPSFASIVNGGHDLSAKGVGNGTDSTTEVCVFCHTPHAAVTNAAVPLANRTTTGSDLCLSCHDGAVNYADISNKSNADLLNAGGADYAFGGPANMGSYDQSVNHPIAVVFNQGANGLVATAPAALIANGGSVTCSSCHDVHEALGSPFLKMNNDKSALCLACHAK